ncbi:molybdopterin-guanine dinucleotide biosynthesis protein A [Deinococcus sp. HSC-46F16]|uniref:molybdenum cofactor guanylyltransferase n=1 Tax=Deinococcus sp. HSC-46F16 TaxID=2910968 RepID=UPI0020A23157|nr:molybdenum cofactor guanylyltransferase [Deinococcus sp. HSC-46F16]MCP2015474.1 molybdopterin-guanine dinucleotide biosynthesis protein A [Deinococcus sp. HSC-46F16]
MTPGTTRRLDLVGALTAGGRSSRFGTDKALARLEGRTLLEHVAASLEGCPLRLLVAPPERYALPGWLPVPDTRPGEGPLGALEAALLAAERHAGPGWVAFAGVDLPRLTPAYWALMAGARTPGARSILTLDPAGRAQPLGALYHTELRPQVSVLLDAGERRLRLAAQDAVTVPYEAVARVSPQALHNVNTPTDLAALEAETRQ